MSRVTWALCDLHAPDSDDPLSVEKNYPIAPCAVCGRLSTYTVTLDESSDD